MKRYVIESHLPGVGSFDRTSSRARRPPLTGACKAQGQRGARRHRSDHLGELTREALLVTNPLSDIAWRIRICA
jgi:hypothetical protein